LKKLDKLNDESNFKKFLDHEDEQKQIVDIFERINEARVRFEVRPTTLFVQVISIHLYLAGPRYKSL